MAAAVIAIGYIVWQYADAQNRNNEIRSVAGFGLDLPETVDASVQLEDLFFDWDALKALNPDVVGWIAVPETNINYPIVQGLDNSFYLHHLFDASPSGTGAIFADYEGSATLDGQHNIIYGHNMFDGTMFSEMLMYSDQDYFDCHRRIHLYTPTRNFELNVVAAINVAADAPLRRFTFEDGDAFASFVQETLSSAETKAPNTPDLVAEAESLYSFVTCVTFDANRRVIICAVPVRNVVPDNV